MSAILVSAIRFVSGAWYVFALAAGIIWDPVDWFVGLGWLKPGTEIFADDQTRVACMLAITAVATFVWYHRQRMAFDGDAAAGEMDLQTVVRRLSERSRWALQQPHQTDDWPLLVREELLTRLSRDERLRAAGHFRKSTGHSAEDGQRWIDPDFWRDPGALHVWDILLLPENRNWASNSRRSEWYERIVLPRAAVERVWPAATIFERLWRRIRFSSRSTADVAHAERRRLLKIATLSGKDLDRQQNSAYRQMFEMHD